MTKFNTVLSILLAIAVGYLLFDKFNGDETLAQDLNSTQTEAADEKGGVAYINVDSLDAQYHYMSDKKIELENFQKKSQGRVENAMNKASKELETMQANVTTEADYMALEKRYQEVQLEIQRKRENAATELLQQETDMHNELYRRINEFLVSYNEEHDYDYILGYQKGGQILYGDSAFDITSDAISTLNSIYDAEIEEAEQAAQQAVE